MCIKDMYMRIYTHTHVYIYIYRYVYIRISVHVYDLQPTDRKSSHHTLLTLPLPDFVVSACIMALTKCAWNVHV